MQRATIITQKRIIDRKIKKNVYDNAMQSAPIKKVTLFILYVDLSFSVITLKPAMSLGSPRNIIKPNAAINSEKYIISKNNHNMFS